VRKFEQLVSSHIERLLREEIIDAVSRLESLRVSDVTRLLGDSRFRQFK